MARNILFEDIRIESIQEGMIFNIRVHFNPKYDKYRRELMELLFVT